MSRYVHNGGAHVYDTDTDQWYRFANPEDGVAFANEIDPQEAVNVEILAPARAVGFTQFVDYRTPSLLLPPDPTRLRAIIYNGSNTAGTPAVIGSREGIGSVTSLPLQGSATAAQGQQLGGYFLGVQATLEIKSSAAVWACSLTFGTPTPPTACAVSVWVEYDNGY